MNSKSLPPCRSPMAPVTTPQQTHMSHLSPAVLLRVGANVYLFSHCAKGHDCHRAATSGMQQRPGRHVRRALAAEEEWLGGQWLRLQVRQGGKLCPKSAPGLV